tara:strand:+ start:2116 stop:2289 length:174 start_codon:yes stop_codon:yes gene_type:complete
MTTPKNNEIDYDNDRVAVRHPDGHSWEGAERDENGDILVPILDVPGLEECGYFVVER